MEGGGGGGESPNGVVIDPVWYGGGEGFYNRDAELNDVVCALCDDGGLLLWWQQSDSFLTANMRIVFRCSDVTMTPAAASTTRCALAHSFTPGSAEAARCRVRIAAGRPSWCRGPHRPRVLVFHD
ncbi:hypothetical protein BAE44_0021742 [Dichanthelium oligosanthes]|uniref:Uncharacterized protein n=1 Tax=Dichanthelium oligosanthes TaxID=888268 RepID=A0A1E5UWL0_9POAL|nr:hypothetical protein BAE44_0021742 [Dichanthelium oligosanthes]